MFIKFCLHLILYEKCTKNVFLYLTGKFSKLCSNKKKVIMVSKLTFIQISLYPWLIGQYMLLYYRKFFFP